MNRKLYLTALLALGGPLAFAADPITPAPVSPTPAPTSAPAPTLPDSATLQGLFLKMGFESATKNWAGLKDDVTQLKPFREQLSPAQQNIFDAATAALSSHGITVPDAAAAAGLVAPATTQPADAGVPIATAVPTASAVPTATAVPPVADPVLPVGPDIVAPTAVPVDPETAAHALVSKTRNDIIAVPFVPMAMQADAARLAATLKTPLAPQTQASCQQALNAAVVRLLTRAKNEIHDHKLPTAQNNLNQLSALPNLPDDLVAQIAAVQAQLTDAAAKVAPTPPKKKKK